MERQQSYDTEMWTKLEELFFASFPSFERLGNGGEFLARLIHGFLEPSVEVGITEDRKRDICIHCDELLFRVPFLVDEAVICPDFSWVPFFGANISNVLITSRI